MPQIINTINVSQFLQPNLARVLIPSGFVPPRSHTFPFPGTQVRADSVTILNYRQVGFENLYYDGSNCMSKYHEERKMFLFYFCTFDL